MRAGTGWRRRREPASGGPARTFHERVVVGGCLRVTVVDLGRGFGKANANRLLDEDNVGDFVPGIPVGCSARPVGVWVLH